MRKPSFKHTLLAGLCLASVQAGAAPDAEAVRAAVERAVKPLMARYEVPGMAVAVSVDGQALFFNYGQTARQDGAAVDEHTLFELGSISKTFTATLACHARGLGKLSFDDHPQRFLPLLGGSAIDRATLLELGTFTAGGLPLQVPDEIADEAQALTWLRGFRTEAAPGTQRRYSNPSIGLFGLLAARALGTGFADAMDGQIFPALGLKESHMQVPPAAFGRYAWGHDKDGKPVRVSPGPFDMEAYGVKSSSADMIRFVQANLAPQRLARPVAEAVACTQVGYFRIGGMVQGLGWEQYRPPLGLAQLLDGNADGMAREAHPATRLAPEPAPPGTLFNKTGSTRGFGAYAAFVPTRRIGVVLLANRNYPNAARVEAGYAILEALSAAGKDGSPGRRPAPASASARPSP